MVERQAIVYISPASSSGPARDDGRSVKEIKDEVKTMVQRARGASAITLLNVAREKAISGFRLEDETNLPEALRELLTAAKLIQLFLETAEFKAESQGRKGVVWKEFTDFQQVRSIYALPLVHSFN